MKDLRNIEALNEEQLVLLQKVIDHLAGQEESELEYDSGSDYKSAEEMTPSFEEEFDPDYKKEISLIKEELIDSALHIRLEDGNKRVYLSEDKITLKFNKKGYLYGILWGEPISGALRQKVLNLLFLESKLIDSKKMGKFELIYKKFNQSTLVFWYNIEEEKISYISSVERAKQALYELNLSEMRDKEKYSSTAVTEQLLKTKNKEEIESEEEIFGPREASLAFLAEEQILDKLELVKEIIEEAKGFTSSQVVDSLEEIKEMI